MNRAAIIQTISQNLGKKLNVRVGMVSYVGYVTVATNNFIYMENVEVHSWEGKETSQLYKLCLLYDEIDTAHVCVKYPEPEEKPKSPHEAVMGRGLIKGSFQCGGARGQTDQGLRVEVIDPHYDGDSTVVRFGDENQNMPLYINKKTASILVAFFTEVEAGL